jgi:hypothetical protein
MIMVKTRERFPDRNNRENNRDNSDKWNFLNNGHQDRKRGPDNTIAMANRMKKFSKFRKFKDIENIHCIWHPKETTQQEITESSLIGMQEKKKQK